MKLAPLHHVEEWLTAFTELCKKLRRIIHFCENIIISFCINFWHNFSRPIRHKQKAKKIQGKNKQVLKIRMSHEFLGINFTLKYC